MGQMFREMALEEGKADKALGVTSYAALQFKNKIMGAVMFSGGVGMIWAGAQESMGVNVGVAQGLVAFGYVALFVNFFMGLFANQANEWTAKQLYKYDIDGFCERALAAEAGHLLMAYVCGLPVQEYSRSHIGYPVR